MRERSQQSYTHVNKVRVLETVTGHVNFILLRPIDCEDLVTMSICGVPLHAAWILDVTKCCLPLTVNLFENRVYGVTKGLPHIYNCFSSAEG
jgi:hypothetical protein